MSGPRYARPTNHYRTYAHPYTGEEWPSVTSVLDVIGSPGLKLWAARLTAEAAVATAEDWVPRLATERDEVIKTLKDASGKASREAAELGTAVHAAIERRILGQEGEEPARLRGHLAQFDAFRETMQARFVVSEATVVNRSVGYAGTLDAIADLSHPDHPQLTGRFLIDWKTGKGVYPEASLQLAAYRHGEALLMPDGTEAEMPRVDGALIVRIRPRFWEIVPVKSGEDAFTRFRLVKEVWYWHIAEGPDYMGAPVRPEKLGGDA